LKGGEAEEFLWPLGRRQVNVVALAEQSHVELGIEPVFWGDGPRDDKAVILPLVRPD
jgi:hypothetical protein